MQGLPDIFLQVESHALHDVYIVRLTHGISLSDGD
jgi:hypothetical protein